MSPYPAEAYAPSGKLWWKTRYWPDKPKAKFGTEPRLAAWLKYNAKIGDILTLRKLRKAIGSSNRVSAQEHFNRRFRALRKYGWTVISCRDLAGLKQNEFRLDKIGKPIWRGKVKFAKDTISAELRREIFESDNFRCVICGIGAGECYPDDQTKKARLSLGYFAANFLHKPNDPANLRTECSRCNVPAKEGAAQFHAAKDLLPKIRALGRAQKARLLRWVENGQRERDSVDHLFDQYRSLAGVKLFL